jgi:hypothetical protein
VAESEERDMTQVDIDTAQTARRETPAFEEIELVHTRGRVSTMTGTAARMPAASPAPARRLARLAGWLSAQLADPGVSARFAAERQRDEGLVRRVERRRRD